MSLQRTLIAFLCASRDRPTITGMSHLAVCALPNQFQDGELLGEVGLDALLFKLFYKSFYGPKNVDLLVSEGQAHSLTKYVVLQ